MENGRHKSKGHKATERINIANSLTTATLDSEDIPQNNACFISYINTSSCIYFLALLDIKVLLQISITSVTWYLKHYRDQGSRLYF
jgi:hypothetical protein